MNSPQAAGSVGEHFHQQLLDASTQVLVAFIDHDGRIGYVSAGVRSLLGFEPSDLVGRPCGVMFPSGSEANAAAKLLGARRGRPRLLEPLLAQRKDGTRTELIFDAAPLGVAGEAAEGIVVTAYPGAGESAGSLWPDRDIPPGGELIEDLPAVIYVAAPGEDGEWHYVSPQIERMLGYSAEEWVADPHLWASRVHAADRDRVLREEERDTVRGAPIASEYRLLTRAGNVVWVRDEAVLRFDADGSPRYEGLLIDITERKRFESELQFLAEHDSLTGLCNRRRFLVELETEVKRLRRHDQAAAVVMLDLDGLKAVNDAFGHRVGDAVLRATAVALNERLRESDTVARLGGDEFAVLLRGTGSARAAVIGDELIDAISARTRLLTNGRASTRVSIGVAEVDRRSPSAEAVLANADSAMYRAKRSGGGRVESSPGAVAS